MKHLKRSIGLLTALALVSGSPEAVRGQQAGRQDACIDVKGVVRSVNASARQIVIEIVEDPAAAGKELTVEVPDRTPIVTGKAGKNRLQDILPGERLRVNCRITGEAKVTALSVTVDTPANTSRVPLKKDVP